MHEDPYQVLGVSRGATDEQIRSAYRNLARRLHPDASGSPDTAEAFRKITDAYCALLAAPRPGASGGERVPVRHGPAARRTRAEPLRGRPRRGTRREPRAAAEPLRQRGRFEAAPAPEPLLRPDPGAEPLGTRRGAPYLHPTGGRSWHDELESLLWLLGADYFKQR